LGENDGAGPNLTDNYWLHGGGIQDVFKSIKYGWTDKGMKSWKEDLSPVQIAQVASYIKSLKGSAATGKAAQGDLYQEAGSTLKADSLAAPADSVKAKAVADSLDIAAKAKK
jgi:cytochrome c oxidase cbb3-type subunit 3